MRVFVTGGTGLLGRHVVERLVARGDAVRGLARSESAARALVERGVTPVRAGLDDADTLTDEGASADAVVHAAAIVLDGGGWPAYEAANVAPLACLARAAARGGARFVHVSSVAVYGRRTTYDGGPGSVDESFGLDRPLFDGDHYARSKREAERTLRRIVEATGLRAIALRPCVLYGEGDRHFTNRVARWLARGVAPLLGDGRNPISAVYAGNVADAVVAALDRPEATGAVNVTNDGELTAREFFERFARGLGVRLRLVPVPRGLVWRGAVAADAMMRLLRPRQSMTTLKAAVQFLVHANPYVSERARDVLGWRPGIPPGEAVERTARWFAEGNGRRG